MYVSRLLANMQAMNTSASVAFLTPIPPLLHVLDGLL